MTYIYVSISYALAENKQLLLESSREFQDIVQPLRTGPLPCLSKDQVRLIFFALNKAAKLVYHAKFKYIIGKSM